jgi:hypothetical protein
MGNDWQPPDSLSQKGSTGILSSLVNTVTNVVMGDGTEPVYAGHPGATGSFIGGADKQLAITNPDNRYSNQSSYNAPGGGGAGAPLRRGSSTSATTTYSASGMAGVGNPNFKDARDEKSWMQKAGEVASNLSTMAGLSGKEGVGPVGSPPYGAAGAGPDGWNYATNRGPNAYGRQDEGYQPNRTMNALGSNASVNYNGWNQPSSSSSAYPSSSGSGGIVPDIPASVGPLGSGKVGGGADDGEYERSLIDALCEPGGLKPIPPEQKLQEFLASATTLSPDLIGSCLLDILLNNEISWQSKIKALIVIANLALAKNNCVNHAEWWKIPENHDQIRILCNDAKASVRTQAAKTLKIVTGISSSSSSSYPTSSSLISGDGGDDYAPPTSSSAGSIKSSSTGIGKQQQDSLLDLLDDDINPVASLPVSTTNSPLSSHLQHGMKTSPMIGAAGGGMDLFSGMSIGGSTTPKSISDDPVKSSLSPYTSSNNLINNPTGPSSLSSLSTDNSSLKQSQQQQQPIKTINISEHFDFLNDEPVVTTPPPPSFQQPQQQQQQNSNLFDNLNLSASSTSSLPKSSSSTSYQDDFAALSLHSTPSNPPSSSFGFLNNTSSNNGNMNNGGMMTPTYRTTPGSSSAISSAFVESNTNPNKNSNNKAFSQVKYLLLFHCFSSNVLMFLFSLVV